VHTFGGILCVCHVGKFTDRHSGMVSESTGNLAEKSLILIFLTDWLCNPSVTLGFNSFYFNQHMHYTFVVIYTPTYVSTTY
jgi:hypothetical protein